ncbi:hypothetical protein Tco_1180645, partial [Tanacetum coccineum]
IGTQTTPEKLHESCEIKATNIVLQGLTQDIYNLVNHHEEAKHIWDRVKLLIEDYKILLQERELKLYDEFNMFSSVPGEIIHSYYLRFAQLIINMHSIGITMRPVQVNTKFINLCHPKWSKFVTDVKLAKDLNNTNFDQLYAYLRHHEAHADDVHIMKERFLNPLALTVQGRQHQGYAGSGTRSNATGVNRTRGTNTAAWFKEKAMLAEALESGMVLDEEKIAFLADNGDTVPIHDNYLDDHVIDQNVQKMQYYEQLVFNNDTNIDITSDNVMIMSVIEEMNNQVAKCNKVDKENKIIHESLTTELKRYKEQIKLFEERQQFYLNDREKYIDSKLRKVIVDKNAKVTDSENQIHLLKQQLNATVKSHKTLSTTVDVLKIESKVKEDKYLGNIIDLEKKNKALDNVIYKMGQSMQTMHIKVPALYCGNTIIKKHDALSVIDTDETLELAEETRLKMHAKQNDPIILVKDSFNKMRNRVNDFENVVTVRTKVTGQNEGSWEFEHIQKAFDKDVKPFVKTLKEYFHMFDQGLHKEITNIKDVFTQMETKAAKCSVERKTFEIKEKELLLEKDHLLELLISQELVHTVVNSLAKIIDYQSMEKSFLDEYSECVELKVELLKKNEMVEKAVYDKLSK